MGSIQNQLVQEIGHFMLLWKEIRYVNGVLGALHSSSDWISLKTHQITPPPIL